VTPQLFDAEALRAGLSPGQLAAFLEAAGLAPGRLQESMRTIVVGAVSSGDARHRVAPTESPQQQCPHLRQVDSVASNPRIAAISRPDISALMMNLLVQNQQMLNHLGPPGLRSDSSIADSCNIWSPSYGIVFRPEGKRSQGGVAKTDPHAEA
jgi:hypothetical protein